MKTGLLIVGIVLFVYGLHWIGQGTGWLPWPAGTVMDYNMAFTWAGLGLLAAASGMIWYFRRS
ncbi:MAG: LPXTG cell wall anchor domain-containing protein [Proteobacteria bacterium]|nr:LPXTG cell wall anchor domain-containing protein [Pseudomonadota bacterium]